MFRCVCVYSIICLYIYLCVCLVCAYTYYIYALTNIDITETDITKLTFSTDLTLM